MNFFMADVSSSWIDELSDDLRGLQHERDGERREQDESGGQAGDLGHLSIPSSVRCCVVDYKMPGSCFLDASAREIFRNSSR